jgi:phasin family protein
MRASAAAKKVTKMDNATHTLPPSTTQYLGAYAPSGYNQRNVEAMMKFGRLWVAGMQDISKTMTIAAQSHIDDAFSNWKALSGVKTLSEAIALQTGFARTSLEKAVAETNSLTTASMKLAEASLTPISTWMTTTTATFTQHPG